MGMKQNAGRAGEMSDVIVVGAGIVGAACAWRLAQRGAKVTLLERSAPASGASQAALGVLTFHASVGKPAELNALHLRSAKLYADMMSELEAGGHGEIYYRQEGGLFIALQEADLGELKAEYELNMGFGVQVEKLTPEEIHLLEPAVNRAALSGIYYPGGAWVDNTALTLAVVQAARQAGVAYQQANVRAIMARHDRATGVRSSQGPIEADWVVLAAGCWTSQLEGAALPHIIPVRGQALAVGGQAVRRVVFSPRWYLVPKLGVQIMVGATKERVGYDDRVTLGGMTEVGRGGIEIAPSLAGCEVVSTWAGLRPASLDELPVIGSRDSLPNLILATGHYRNGIVLAPVTAELVAEMIRSSSPVEGIEPFRPGRPTLGGPSHGGLRRGAPAGFLGGSPEEEN
jgi:glycine oxidase